MSTVEFSEDYKTALQETSAYLEPTIRLTKHESSIATDKVVLRQLNTLLVLNIRLYDKVNKLEDGLQLIEDKLQGTPEDIKALIDSIKTTSISNRKPRLNIGPQKFQVVSKEYSKNVK